MIIFGWNRKTLHTHRGVFFQKCAHCSGVCNFDVIYRITWFTLFFIPVIPYQFEYFIRCSVCGSAYQVTGSENIAKLKEMVRQAKQGNAQSYTPAAPAPAQAPAAQAASTAGGWPCPKCRTANDGDARFCKTCGYRAV